MNDFFYGMTLPFRGLALLSQMPKVLWLCFWPFMIYAALFTVGLLTFAKYLIPWVVARAGQVLIEWGIYNSIVSWILEFFVWLWAILALTFLIFLLARIIAAPFYSLLAEKTLNHLGDIPVPAKDFRQWVRFNIHMLWVSIVESMVFGVVGIGLLIVSVIPGLNLVSAFGVLLLVAYDSADYGYEIVGFNFRQRLGFFKKHLAGYCGLAMVLTLTSLLPGLNFILFPVTVVGSTMYLSKKRTV